MELKAAFGGFFKARRQSLKLTLREFCLKHRLDPGNVSRLERGLLAPPQGRDRLEEYAKYLSLKKGSDDWYSFLDLAAASKGRIPSELMKDEEIVAKLPLVFRTLRGKRLADGGLDGLVRRIRAD